MFNWFSSKPKGTLQEPTPLELQRSKQIQQLRHFHQNVSEVQRNLEYQLPLTIQGEAYSLYVTLPPRFPVDKPLVKITPGVKHPWVDELMNITGNASINNFGVHSDLGKAVKEIVEEFQRNPPMKVAQNVGPGVRYNPYPISSQQKNDTYPSYTGAYPPPKTTVYNAAYPSQTPMPTLPATTTVNYPSSVTNSDNPSLQSNMYKPGVSLSSSQYADMTPQVMSQPTANVPDVLPELQGMSDADLKKLLEDEVKFEKFVMSLAPIQRMMNEKETLIERNRQQAIENLSKKPILEEKKRLILEKYEHLNELKHTFDGTAQRQEDLLRGYTPQAVQDRLKIAALQAEEEAEAIAERFLEGKMSMEDFKRSYTEIRKLSHLRKAKEEKLHTAMLQYGKT